MKGLTVLFLAIVALASRATLAASSPSQQQPFSYRVVVPADEGTCADQAARIAQLFASSTKAQNVVGLCRGQNTVNENKQTYQQNVIVINYSAPFEMTLNHTVIGGGDFDGTSNTGSGLFSTYQGCLSARAQQLQYFTSYTGLTALDSHCDNANQLLDTGWSLVIDSFGDAAAQLYVFKPFQDSDSNVSDILNIANDAIQKFGGHVVYSDSQRSFYYAKGDVDVSFAAGPFFDKVEQCNQQLTDAYNIFNSHKGAYVGVICHQDSMGFIQMAAVGHKANEIDEDDFSNTTTYATFDDCMADRTRFEGNLHSQGVALAGVICAPALPGSTGYTMHVYTPWQY